MASLSSRFAIWIARHAFGTAQCGGVVAWYRVWGGAQKPANEELCL